MATANTQWAVIMSRTQGIISQVMEGDIVYMTGQCLCQITLRGVNCCFEPYRHNAAPTDAAARMACPWLTTRVDSGM